MLRLERMEVSGFKSFPDRTAIEFPDGITAVVGPNGCGKSNIADAVQWVLGEQSARALRGAKMEDVIFNGSQERGPGGLAEVTLHLVGRGDAPADGRRRVVITRRLFRSGDSEYLVDGKKARLADIRDILDDIRAGVRSYAIIDQAQVASFVVSKPKERRIFIEEAAGIANYKGRRRLADLKLEATRGNLLRVDDILREVDRQRRSLQRQASLARRARRLDEQHRLLRTYWFATRGRRVGRRLTDVTESLAVARRESTHLEQERSRLADVLAAVREGFESARAGREQAVEAQHRLELEEQRLGQEIEGALARAAAIEDDVGRQAGEERRLDEESDRRQDEIASREQDVAQSDEGLAEMDGALERLRAEADSARGALAAGQASVDRLEQELYRRLHERADLAARLAAAREAASQEHNRANEAAETGLRLHAGQQAAREAVTAAEVELKRAGDEADHRVRVVDEERGSEESALHRLEEARAHDAQLAAEQGGKAGEKAALDSLAVRLAGAEAARDVLEQARDGSLAVRSVVADLVRVDQPFEQAAESFLSETLPAIVVETTADVVRGAGLVGAGRVSFLPLDAGANGEAQRSYAHLPAELAAEPRIRGRLAARVFATGDTDGVITSRLDDALLVNDLAAALDLHARFPHWNFLTPEGHTVRASGVVTIEGGGDVRRDGLLARARRRDELAAELAQLEERRAQSRRLLEDAQALRQEAQSRRREAEEALAGARDAASTARLGWEQAVRELTRLDRELGLLAVVREAAERGRDEAQRRAEALEQSLREAEALGDSARAAREEARVQVRACDEAVNQVGGRLARLEGDWAGRVERRAALVRDLERLREELAALTQQSAGAAERRLRSLEDATRLRREADESRQRLERTLQERSAARAGGQRWDAEVARCGDQARAAEERLGLATEENEAARARREQLALEAGRAQADYEHLQSACHDELKVDPQDLPAAPPDAVDPVLLADDDLLAERVAQLRDRRERLGPVNPLAEQEYADLSARHETLSVQRNDLVETIEELTSSIRRMDKESRERFLEAFAAIRRHFREQFAVLFRGGRADLVLEDEENPLECGIEILCQPPGKKLQAVTLLSGGEKALAATAVLFAIFKHQPPPFCLLDEVDAPLDDANVTRFADAIRSFAGGTQFIVITHNKRSMELADILYGVTMPEPGVSRIVSMTLD